MRVRMISSLRRAWKITLLGMIRQMTQRTTKVKMNVRTKVTIKDLLNEQGSLKVSNFLWPWDRGPEMVPAESGYVEYSLGH